MNKSVTFEEAAEAVAKITNEQPSKEQIAEAYEKTREAVDKILNPSDKAKKAMGEMGIQTLKIGGSEITSEVVAVSGIRREDHCGIKTYFAIVQTYKSVINPRTYMVESIPDSTEVEISKEEYEKYEKELWSD